MAVLRLPLVLLKSALRPLAVLLPPAILCKSAFTPVAVLLEPVVVAGKGLCSVSRVDAAVGIARESGRSSGRVFLGNRIV